MNNINENENSVEFSEQIVSEISILDLIALMIRNWWIIVIVGAIFGIATYAYSKTTAIPTYRSTGSLYIDTQREQTTDELNAKAIFNARDLMPTYVEVLQSRTFASIVSDAVDNKYSYSEIKRMVTFTPTEDTNIVNVSIVCMDQQDSFTICESILNLAPDEILRVFESGSVKIIDHPTAVPETLMANSLKRGAVGFLVGAALAMFFIFLLNMFDTRIESSEELASRYNLPVLGEAPNLASLSK